MKRRIYESDRIATTNQRGDTVIVIEETLQSGFTRLNPPSTTWKDGPRSYRTVNGEPVNWISDSEFELVLTGETLNRV